MVKLAYDPKMKNPKGPCVIVLHASWCGFCKTLMPKFENEIVTSQNFSKELGGLLTLGSIEEAEYNKYNNHPEKNIFGSIDGYPTIRYIRFCQHGKPLRSFDLPGDTPREPKDIIAWINGAVKNDVVKNDVVKNDVVKNDVVKNDINDDADMVKKQKHIRKSKKQKIMMNGGGKYRKYRTVRKKYKTNKKHKKE
jgi:thiol-disulfide isomerase/thioredoxin